MAYLQLQSGIVVDRVAWDGDPEKWQPPGGATMLPDRVGVNIGDVYDPSTDTFARAAAAAPWFLARDMLALFTVDDFAAIKSAISASDALSGLWYSLLAQGEAPIAAASARFQQGWAGLTQALGQERADAIAAALGIA